VVVRKREGAVGESGKIMRVCVLLSFFLHALLTFTFKDAFSSLWTREDLRVYKIDLIRPPVEEIDAEREADADLAKSSREEKPPAPEENQDTISLDTTDKRYVDYARAIKEQILSRWKYPTEAKDNLIEGKLLVVFSLGMHGEMKEIRIAEPSGHQILDAEATRAIRSAAPFPPFPNHVTVARLNIKASFDYRIKAKK
jgi:TonB family protein